MGGWHTRLHSVINDVPFFGLRARAAADGLMVHFPAADCEEPVHTRAAQSEREREIAIHH
jgi:hypothetical protein